MESERDCKRCKHFYECDNMGYFEHCGNNEEGMFEPKMNEREAKRMITFKTIGYDDKVKVWKYHDAKELETIWRSDNICMCVPENDAPIFDVIIDGKPDIKEATFERIGTDSVWFEDLLTYVGIDTSFRQ